MDAIRLTGLWKSKDKNGGTFLSGKLNAVSSFLVMPNTYKKSDSDPDFFLYVKQNPKEGGRDRPAAKPPSDDIFS